MQTDEERIALQADITQWLKHCQEMRREPDLDGIRGILELHQKSKKKPNQIITVNCYYPGPMLQFDISTIENPATGARITMADVDEIYCKHAKLYVHIKGIANPVEVDYIHETEADFKWPLEMEIFDTEGVKVAHEDATICGVAKVTGIQEEDNYDNYVELAEKVGFFTHNGKGERI
tara:strand:- start:37974 stop:38504 length:531 start_codon:yes stop_codon:yes gene_type:complete